VSLYVYIYIYIYTSIYRGGISLVTYLGRPGNAVEMGPNAGLHK